MKPPDCYVCHRTLSDVPDHGRRYFTPVRFGETEQEKMAPSRAMDAAGRAGHLYNAIWFCNDHLSLARKHADRHLADALAAIKADPGLARSRHATTSSAASSGSLTAYWP